MCSYACAGLPLAGTSVAKRYGLKSALTKATDVQNGDHTQLIRALAPAARQGQPRRGSTPHLGRGQQQHAIDANQSDGGRLQQIDARVRGLDR